VCVCCFSSHAESLPDQDVARQRSLLLVLKSNPVPVESAFLGLNL
jgi:hypothetical protein